MNWFLDLPLVKRLFKPVPPRTALSPLDAADELDRASYQQNSETFRALNALMWQVPLIAMTLTGGLWFGVASLSKDSGLTFLRPGLLLLAGVGDFLLIVILERLRHIIGEYLVWLGDAHPRGYVAAKGHRFWNSSKVVKSCFQIMLSFAAITSFVLFYKTMTSTADDLSKAPSTVAWYDTHARALADDYEGLDAEQAHPQLFEMLRGVKGARVLDVGSGSGRDAVALAKLGHRVTAVEPSSGMLSLARALHKKEPVTWLSDAMPSLSKVKGAYDVVLLSAVWMHVPPSERPAAFSRLVDLTAPGGRIFITLRLGPGDVQRAMWSVSAEEVERLAKARGVSVRDLGKQLDLLGRSEISWQTIMISRGDHR